MRYVVVGVTCLCGVLLLLLRSCCVVGLLEETLLHTATSMEDRDDSVAVKLNMQSF